MITFKQFLAERETAGVYVNKNGRLTLLADLIQDYFGLKFNGLAGGCLATQMLYTIEATTGVRAQDLVDAAGKELQGNYEGVTLEKLFKIYNNRKLKLPQARELELNLSSHVYTKEQAVSEVKAGQPVVIVLSSWTNFDGDDNGFIEPEDALKAGSLHALLIVGYDDDEKAFILREARRSYGFEGYGKIVLKDTPTSHYKLLGIHVDNFKLTDLLKKKDKKK